MAIAVPLIASALSALAPSLLQKLFPGKKERVEQIPTKTTQQQQLLNQLLSGIGGKEGALNAAISNLTNLLRGGEEAFSQFEAPALRQFQEQIVPTIAERFAGADALDSSGFRQSLGAAGASLAENLAARRADLSQNALSNLQNLLSIGLGQTQFQPIFRPSTPGVGTSLAPSFGKIFGEEALPSLAENLVKFLSGGNI